jgi:hypothetical protein
MNWQLQRLVDEWVKHERLIIAVDFDDTICPFGLVTSEHTMRMDRTRALLRHCVQLGARIVIHTASDPDRYAFIRRFCTECDIPVEAINQNLPGLKYGTASKPYANIYLDDRAGIEATLDLLSAAAAIMSAHKGNNTF